MLISKFLFQQKMRDFDINSKISSVNHRLTSRIRANAAKLHRVNSKCINIISNQGTSWVLKDMFLTGLANTWTIRPLV